MTDTFEVEPIVRLHSKYESAYIEVGTDPDFPEIIQIRTMDEKSRDYFGPVSLSLGVAHIRQLAEALIHVANAVEKFDR